MTGYLACKKEDPTRAMKWCTYAMDVGADNSSGDDVAQSAPNACRSLRWHLLPIHSLVYLFSSLTVDLSTFAHLSSLRRCVSLLVLWKDCLAACIGQHCRRCCDPAKRRRWIKANHGKENVSTFCTPNGMEEKRIESKSFSLILCEKSGTKGTNKTQNGAEAGWVGVD